jgi:hypothetical protein
LALATSDGRGAGLALAGWIELGSAGGAGIGAAGGGAGIGSMRMLAAHQETDPATTSAATRAGVRKPFVDISSAPILQDAGTPPTTAGHDTHARTIVEIGSQHGR